MKLTNDLNKVRYWARYYSYTHYYDRYPYIRSIDGKRPDEWVFDGSSNQL